MKILQFIVSFLLLASIATAQTFTTEVRPFLPGVFSQFPNVRDITIASAQNEIYFTLRSHQNQLSAIVVLNKEGNEWSEPQVASFSGQYHDLEPFLSPDGLRLFFASNRPVSADSLQPKDFDIWYVERQNLTAQWSEPVNAGTPVNTAYNEFYPAIASNNNLYFTSDAPGSTGKDDIFVSKWHNHSYLPPTPLPETINSAGYEFNAYISPDESFLLFSGYNRNDGQGGGDLYISFRTAENTWTPAKNLGTQVNSSFLDYSPFVDIANGVLYFTSNRSAVPRFFAQQQNIAQLIAAMTRYDNGQSRIYYIEFETLK